MSETKWEAEERKRQERNAAIERGLAAWPQAVEPGPNGLPVIHLGGITAPRVSIPHAVLILEGVEGAHRSDESNPHTRELPHHRVRLVIEKDSGAKICGQDCGECRIPLSRFNTNGHVARSEWHVVSGYASTGYCGPIAGEVVRQVARVLAARYVHASDLRAGYVAQVAQAAADARSAATSAAQQAQHLADVAHRIEAQSQQTAEGAEVWAVLDENGRMITTTTNADVARALAEHATSRIRGYAREEGRKAVAVSLFPEVKK